VREVCAKGSISGESRPTLPHSKQHAIGINREDRFPEKITQDLFALRTIESRLDSKGHGISYQHN